MRKLALFMASLFLAVGADVALADGKALVSANGCGDCHKMQGPAAATIAEVLKRKAPDLFYAGSKFNKEWLVGYLQNPTTLRPGGVVYLNNITVAGETDTVGKVDKCSSKLSAGDAAAVADYLMTLTDPKMPTGVFKAEKIKKAKARQLLFKAESCNACHEFKKYGGGLSCPTMVGAGARLNPDWMLSFIKNPHYWDPKAWMAKSDLSEGDLQLIVNFLVTQ